LELPFLSRWIVVALLPTRRGTRSELLGVKPTQRQFGGRGFNPRLAQKRQPLPRSRLAARRRSRCQRRLR